MRVPALWKEIGLLWENTRTVMLDALEDVPGGKAKAVPFQNHLCNGFSCRVSEVGPMSRKEEPQILRLRLAKKRPN